MLNLWLFPSVNFRWYSIGQAPSGVRIMPDRVGINVGSLSLQQPQGLLFFHALGMFCQPLNAASLAAFVETACAQRWFTCKLIAAPWVKKAWPVLSQTVRAPPARYISITWWGTGQHQTVSLLPLFFFFLSRKEKKAWEKRNRCLFFLENHWMLFTVTPRKKKFNWCSITGGGKQRDTEDWGKKITV